MIDQGPHMIDLSRMFLVFVNIRAVHTYFWDMPVDDNGFIYKIEKNEATFLHVSCTEWKKSLFMKSMLERK